MKYLGIEEQELEKLGAIHTAREISQQPELWKKVYEEILAHRRQITAFFQGVKGVGRIILTGAGTSAYIGSSLRGTFQRTLGIVTEDISTTDLVSHPNDYFHADTPTLLVSFARSGNSPESAAAVSLADKLCKKCYHLIVTCNPGGLLANCKTRSLRYVFVLPSEANDQSLAMTSSYTGMLLAGKFLADSFAGRTDASDLPTIVRYARKTIDYYAGDLRQIAGLDFKRAVFLGSGPFYGTALEAHLKLQELTDGKVICKNDSYLGFRHGPKVVIDEKTLVVYFFSNDSYSLSYEMDLVNGMTRGTAPLAEVSISESPIDGISVDHSFIFSDNGKSVDEDLLAVCSIVPAQILAFYKSLHCGLRPDAPSATGAITRVVEGVQIYKHG